MSTQGQISPQPQSNNSTIQLKTHELSHGKPTKSRREEPSMFQLLTWQNSSLTRHDFKKNSNFQQVPEAYLQQIERQPWQSEAKENYVVPDGCVSINQQTMYKVENYIHGKKGKLNQRQQNKSPCQNQRNQIKNNGNNESPPHHFDNQNYQRSSNQNIKRPSSPDLESNPRERENSKFRPTSPDPYVNNAKNIPYRKNAFGFQENQQNQVTQQASLKQRQQLIEKFKQTTRWISNSAFTTYFGKPPFENYGYGNVKPTKGGLVYGTYLYSHNVHPHRGMNSPKSIQSYPVALTKAKSQGTIVPYPPKTKNPDLNCSVEGKDMGKKFSNIDIYPEPNLIAKLEIEVPNLMDIEKFGGTGIPRKSGNGNNQNPANQQEANTKPRKNKGKVNCKKVQNSNIRDEYEDWVVLKEEQKKGYGSRPASAQGREIIGRKVQYAQ